MSLILNLLNNQTREQETSSIKETTSNLAGLAILGGSGVYFAGKTNVKEALNKSSQVLKRTGKQNELGALGQSTRSAADNLAEFKEKIVRDTISKVEQQLQENFDRVFDNETPIEERRAFFAGLFDTLRSQQAESNDSNIERLIKTAFKDVNDIDEAQRETLKTFYNQRIKTSEKGKRSLNKSINRYKGNMQLYADEMAEFDIPNQVKIDTVEMRDLDRSYGVPETIQKIKDRYQKLQGLAGSGATISLESVDEWGDGGTKSLYARVSYGGRNSSRFILSLGRNQDGQAVYRASESMATRYVAPQKVLNAPGIFSQGNMSSIDMGRLDANTLDFEDYLFNFLQKKYYEHGSLANMSKREYGAFLEFSRSFGMEAPRAMFDNVTEGMNRNLYMYMDERFVDKRLSTGIYSSRYNQSSMSRIVGLENFTPEQRSQVLPSLLKLGRGRFDSVIGAATAIDQIENPFDRNANLAMGSIRYADSGFTPLKALKNYGTLDRTIVPLTARVEQVVGRPEALVGLGGDQAGQLFGKRANIQVSASGGDLIGIDRNAGSVVGINVGGIFIRENKANFLGLGEGAAYAIGAPTQLEYDQKTVANIGISSTNIIGDLIAARKDSNSKFLKIGTGPGFDMTKEEFFKKYGGRDGDVILGDLDADFVRIRNIQGLESFNIGIVEESDDLGRRRFHIGVPKLTRIKGNKMFGLPIKHTTVETNQALIIYKLDQGNLGIEGREVARTYVQEFGGTTGGSGMMSNTLFMSTEQIKKSPQAVLTSMVGGLTMLGVDRDTIEAQLAKELAQLDATQGRTKKQGDFLFKATKNIAELGRSLGVSATNMGFVLSIAEEMADEGKFGFNKQLFTSALQGAGFRGNELNELNKSLSYGIHIGASYTGGAGSRLNLFRGEAKVEERFANYTYTSLRNNYGLTEKEAQSFLNSIFMRSAGVETKGPSVMGMLLNMESLSKMPGDLFEGRIGNLDLRNLSEAEVKELITKDERGILDFLSQSKTGSIIDFSTFLGGEKLEKIKAELGGRTKIILPGADTLENLQGHEIKAGNKVMQLEAEYNRYMVDLVASINGLTLNQGEEFDRSLRGMRSVASYSARFAGSAIRGVLTHARILGSGQMEGQGYIIGAKPGMQTDLYPDAAKNIEARNRFMDLFNQEKGLMSLIDAQGFLDTHLSYEAGIKVDLASRNPEMDKGEIAKTARAATQERLRNFFLNNFRSQVSRVSSTTMRNPMLYVAHMHPGSALYRSDYLQEADPYFGYLKRDMLRYTDEQYEDIKAARNKIKKDEYRAALTAARVTDTAEQDKLLRGIEVESEENKETRKVIAAKLKEFNERRAGVRATRGAVKDGTFIPGAAQDELIQKYRLRNLELYKGIEREEFFEQLDGIKKLKAAAEAEADEFFQKDVEALQKQLRGDKRAALGEFAGGVNQVLKESFDDPIAEGNRSFNDILKGIDPDMASPSGVTALRVAAKRRLMDVYNARQPKPGNMVKLPDGRFVAKEVEKAMETLDLVRAEIDEAKPGALGRARVALEKAIQKNPSEYSELSIRDINKGVLAAYEEILEARVLSRNPDIVGAVANQDSFFGELRSFYGLGDEGYSAFRGDDKLKELKNAGRDKLKAMSFEDQLKFLKTSELIFGNQNIFTPIIQREELKARKRELLATNKAGFEAARKKIKDEIYEKSDYARRRAEIDEQRAELTEQENKLKATAGYRKVTKTSKSGKQYEAYEAYNEEEAKGKVANEEQKKALKAIDEEEEKFLATLDSEDRAVYERMEARRELGKKLKSLEAFKDSPDVFKAVMETVDQDELEMDEIARNLRYTKRNIATPVRELQVIEEALGRGINSFKDLAEAEDEIMGMKEKEITLPSGKKMTVGSAFDNLFSRMLDYHVTQPGGGGTLYMMQMNVDFELEDLKGSSLKKYSGRMDLSRFGIGDFDADIYQVFHDIDADFMLRIGSNAASAENAIDHSGLFRTGGHFMLMMDQLNKGMDAFGKRMGASELTDMQYLLDEQEKEKLVKAVGNLDVQVKTGVFGMIQSAADAGGEEGFQKTVNRMMAGLSLIAVAEEVLSIKGKKLKIAADMGGRYKESLSRAYAENNADHIINFLEENVFKGTALEGDGFRVKKDGMRFLNLEEGAATNYFKSIYGEIEVTKSGMYDAIREMVNAVSTQGLHVTSSDTRLGAIRESSDRMSYEKFVQLLSSRKTVQGGFLGAEDGLDEIERIMSTTRQATETFAAFAGKSKGIVGMVGAGLAAAYGFGAVQNVNSLDGETKFSDAIAKESLGGRGLNNMVGREHNNVAPSNIIPPTNFYERSISRMQTTMTANTSTRFYGEAASISSAQGVASQYIRSGGTSSFFINDSRLPISNSYVTKSIKD